MFEIRDNSSGATFFSLDGDWLATIAEPGVWIRGVRDDSGHVVELVSSSSRALTCEYNDGGHWHQHFSVLGHNRQVSAGHWMDIALIAGGVALTLIAASAGPIVAGLVAGAFTGGFGAVRDQYIEKGDVQKWDWVTVAVGTVVGAGAGALTGGAANKLQTMLKVAPMSVGQRTGAQYLGDTMVGATVDTAADVIKDPEKSFADLPGQFGSNLLQNSVSNVVQIPFNRTAFRNAHGTDVNVKNFGDNRLPPAAPPEKS